MGSPPPLLSPPLPPPRFSPPPPAPPPICSQPHSFSMLDPVQEMRSTKYCETTDVQLQRCRGFQKQ